MDSIKQVLVSLVSDQTLANVLFIKATKADEYVFLETSKTKESQKTAIIRKAAGLPTSPGTCRQLVVDAEGYDKCLQALETEAFEPTHHYLVNITGGTKIMALAARDFFSKFDRCDLYYIPVETNFAQQLTGQKATIALPQLNLREYLKAHGFSYRDCEPKHPEYLSRQLFLDVLHHGDISQVPDIKRKSLPDYLGSDKPFYSGGWFEEWLYFTCLDTLGLKKSHIAFQAKIFHHQNPSFSSNDYEIDVAFCKNNKLYLIEAKAYSGSISVKKISDALYKIASIRTTLGLHAQALVAIMAKVKTSKGRVDNIEKQKKTAECEAILGFWRLEKN